MSSFNVALVGHPNSGKTSLFNALTGLNQRIGNYPGVTVDRKTAPLSLGSGKYAQLSDLPGINSLYPAAEDERIACEVLRDTQHPDYPDMVVVVADITQLRRGALLCTQLIDMGHRVLLAANMADLVSPQEGQRMIRRLSAALDVPALLVSARSETGLRELRELIRKGPPPQAAPSFHLPPGVQPVLDKTKQALNSSSDYVAWQALLRPEDFPAAKQQELAVLAAESGIEDPAQLIYNELIVRYDYIDNLLAGEEAPAPSGLYALTDKLDRLLVHRIWGYVIFALIMLLVFQAIFSWAEIPMDLIDSGFAYLSSLTQYLLGAGWLSRLLTEGILAGVGGVVIFVPQIAFLFLFIALMEESGYMARVVFLMDRIMKPFGMSGRSVIPLVGGMACAVPSIMMARSIAQPRERLITIMVTPLMSCSARIPVYILLVGMFVPESSALGPISWQGLAMTGLYLLGFVMALAAAGVMRFVLRYKAESIFVTEMPLFRLPRWRNVLLTIYQKCKTFILEAGKIILLISILLWILASFGPKHAMQAVHARFADASIVDEAAQQEKAAALLEASYVGQIGRAIEPAIRPMGFDWKIGIGLLTSFAAREVFVGAMATLYSVADGENNLDGLRSSMMAEKDPLTGAPRYSPAVAAALLVFYAFAMQCMSTLAVTRRETGSWKWTFVMLTYLTLLAYVAAWITFRLFSL